MAKFNWFSRTPKEEYVEAPIVSDEQLEEEAVEVEPVKTQRKRNRQICIRLTDEEYEYVVEQAKIAGLNKTEYLIKSACQMPSVVLSGGVKIFWELRKQGVNLNQLVKLCYEYGVDPREVESIVKVNIEAQKKLMELCDKWDISITNNLEDSNGNY